MEFTVFVSNTLHIDKTIWRLWLLGLTINQVITFLSSKRPLVNRNLVLTQYRNFELLESFLHRPKTLHSQFPFTLPLESRQFLIHSYYSLDERVIREILGKKLSSRNRKELEDIVSKTRIPINGCRRMFDNLKRVLKRIEDSESKSILYTIQHDFLLPLELSSQYANIIFINNYRLDTFKKRISYLRLSDFEFMASVFLKYLVIPNTSPFDGLDDVLAQDARDLRSIIFNSKEVTEELKNLAWNHLNESNQGHVMERAGIVLFKTLLRNVLTLGSGILQSKELKEIFIGIQG